MPPISVIIITFNVSGKLRRLLDISADILCNMKFMIAINIPYDTLRP